jgi:exopolysaccharide production protein ExoZ
VGCPFQGRRNQRVFKKTPGLRERPPSRVFRNVAQNERFCKREHNSWSGLKLAGFNPTYSLSGGLCVMSKLINIQILRAVAALTVVLYHIGIETTTLCQTNGTGCVYTFWDGGIDGVSLFFIISGFIMVATSWNAFGSVSGAKDFLLRRLTRIVPLYWVVTTIAIVGIILVPSMLKVSVVDTGYFAASYLFWPVERVNGLVRPIATLGWTLNLEMFFYAVFAVTMVLGRSKGMALAIGLLLFLTTLQSFGLFAKDGAFASVPLNFWGDPIILNFVFGMFVGVAFKRGLRLGFTATWLLVGGCLSGVILVAMTGGGVGHLPEDHVVRRMVLAAPAALLLVGAALGPQFEIKSLLSRFIMLLGDASYSLYLIHPFVLRALTKLWAKFVGHALPEWTFVPVCMVAAIVAGLVLYYLVERPCARFFSRKPRPVVSAFSTPLVPSKP